LPRIRLHDLRHGWASLALAAGVNPKVVSERLGHATVAFPLDTYSHVAPGLQEDGRQAGRGCNRVAVRREADSPSLENPCKFKAPLPGFEPGFPD
jgi:hypothetical protein